MILDIKDNGSKSNRFFPMLSNASREVPSGAISNCDVTHQVLAASHLFYQIQQAVCFTSTPYFYQHDCPTGLASVCVYVCVCVCVCVCVWGGGQTFAVVIE